MPFHKALLRAIFKFGGFIMNFVPVLGIVTIVFLISPFLIVLTKKKQAIHDYIANTVVVNSHTPDFKIY
jgi:uncharacterized RDD family membrane protein YckC